MIAAQHEEVLGVLDLVCEQQADALQTLHNTDRFVGSATCSQLALHTPHYAKHTLHGRRHEQAARPASVTTRAGGRTRAGAGGKGTWGPRST